jgi:hypothetical protein
MKQSWWLMRNVMKTKPKRQSATKTSLIAFWDTIGADGLLLNAAEAEGFTVIRLQ